MDTTDKRNLLMKLFKLAAIFLSTTFFSSLTLASPSASYHHWSGYYAGLNAGLVKHTMSITDVNASSFYATMEQDLNPKLTGGFQLGYRRQTDCFRTSGVYGLEFSANFSNAEFSKEYGSPFALYQLDSKNTLKNVLLLQLTGGIAVDQTLLFLAAGLAWINLTGTTTNLDGAPFFDSFNVNKKQFGTALGAGIEYAFTPTLSARFKVDVIAASNYTTHDDVGNAYQVSNTIVQAVVGLNYNFA
jgi:opacity protein-like surface antigen